MEDVIIMPKAAYIPNFAAVRDGALLAIKRCCMHHCLSVTLIGVAMLVVACNFSYSSLLFGLISIYCASLTAVVFVRLGLCEGPLPGYPGWFTHWSNKKRVRYFYNPTHRVSVWTLAAVHQYDRVLHDRALAPICSDKPIADSKNLPTVKNPLDNKTD